MEKCVYCGADTQLYISGIPVCLKCAEKRDQKIREADSSEKPVNPPKTSDAHN